jgi:5-methylcytosine-specific restriction endonuclease McrA
MAKSSTREIKPTKVMYIKLGRGGKYEEECIEKMQTLRLGYVEENHAQCLAGKWQAIKRHFQRKGKDRKTSSRQANEIKEFYEADERVLWITFYDHKMWWCFSEPVISLLPDKTKTRPAIEGWKCESITGKTLAWSHLRKELVDKRFFRGTICGVPEFEYVARIINGRDRGAKTMIPEEVDTSARYLEGAVKTIPVNAYERNRVARSKCIQHHGWTCAVCGYDMADLYGNLGEEVIHVHHVRELASLGEEYEVDPINDLRPVCPNCHSILHTSSPVMTIERLRKVVLRRKPIRWPARS